MVFSSLVFLYFYLPAVLAIYYLVPKKWRNAALFLCNLLFYGWGEPIYLSIMLLSTLIDYTHGMLVEKYRSRDRLARLFVASSVFFNLLLLIFFKYYDFIAENLCALGFSGIRPRGIPLPIGISFYTFQTMSYTIDVYRGDAKVQKNLLTFGTYVTLFPQLIAGPIVQYKEVAEALDSRQESRAQFASGIRTFVAGLSKKILLANSMGLLWNTYKSYAYAGDWSTAGCWLGALAFSFQIYFDFSGYSDMALGLGRMFGFEFSINFHYPYISKSITEFWRRWHISLSRWFRDYLYIPLGGNRKGVGQTCLNLLIVWLATGIWHGASWNFLLWGVYFGILLVIEKLFLLRRLARAPVWAARGYTLLSVLFSWVLFSVEELPVCGRYFAAMFGAAPLWQPRDLYYFLSFLPLLAISAVACTPAPRQRFLALDGQRRGALTLILCALALLSCTAFLVNATYNPFLYFRF